jgi:putative PIN family toxin of toxin-antitoxin system
MRLVVDANVVVSALISRSGPPAAVIDRLLSGEIALVTSPAWERDVMSALSKEKVVSALAGGDDDARTVVAALVGLSERGQDDPSPPQATADPKDDYLIALACQTGCDAIVSGDRHLLTYGGPPEVLTPRALLERLAR